LHLNKQANKGNQQTTHRQKKCKAERVQQTQKFEENNQPINNRTSNNKNINATNKKPA
jgi:hypothetical protein